MSTPAAQAASRPLTILLVDDDPLVREATAWMLGDAGHTVVQAPAAAAALDALEHDGPFGLVITDINMPGMDGAELARQIRVRWPGLPVLLVSGRPQPPGNQPYMPKPFGWNTLMEAVEAVTHPPLTPGTPTPNTEPSGPGGRS